MTSADLDSLQRQAIRHVIFHMTPRTVLQDEGPWILDSGEGAILRDAAGREFLDALSGGVFAVLAGYGRKEIARAMYDQALRLPYTSPYGTTSEVAVELARTLAHLTPGDLDAAFFCSSGSEAVEAALKLARQYHQATGQGRRYKVISLRRGYHGATVGALSATGWSPGFGFVRRVADPTVPAAGYASAMPPYCHRCELGLTYPDCGLLCARTVEQAILGSDPELVSCVIVEPVLGTGGCIVPPPGWLAQVRQICDRYGILLIADEVVCGCGRTGRWFGVDHWDVVPDIMVLAKGLTSGYAPMAAAVVRRGIADALPIFVDVHTYGGHPVSAAAAVTNLAIIEREGLVDNAATVGAQLLALLAGLRTHPLVADVRGLGLFAAIELHPGPRPAAPAIAGPGADEVVGRVALERGLLVRPLGGVLLLAPPLIFTAAQAERTVEILDEALTTAEQHLGIGTA